MTEVAQIRHGAVQSWAEFAKAAGYLAPLEALGADDLLVLERDVMSVLHQVLPDLTCKTVQPSRAPEALTGARRAVVLIQNREYQFVRKLRQLAPDTTILSFVYDIVPRIKMARAALEPLQSRPEMGFPEIGLLLSAPFSGSSWFCRVLAATGLPQPGDYLDRVMMLWLEGCKGFLPLRYFAAFQQYLDAPNYLEIHITSDALVRLFASSWVPTKKIVAKVWAMQPKILYFSRRDKFAQTMIAQAESHTENQPGLIAFGEQSRDISDAFALMHEILVLESELEDLLEAGDEDFRYITYEELIDSPLPVLRNICAFRKMRLPKTVNLPQLEDRFLVSADLRNLAQDLRKQVEERFGLYRNEFGSLTTGAEMLFMDDEDEVSQA